MTESSSHEVNALPAVERTASGERLVSVQFLPDRILAVLDRMYGDLLARNGGFAHWHQVLRAGKFIEVREEITLRDGINY